MRINIIIMFLLIIILNMYKSYNIDSNSALIKSIQSSNKSSFGFSLSIFSSKNTNIKYILVGSPTVQADNSEIKTSGAFYTCPLTKNYTDCIQRSVTQKTENSLFGYVIDSQDGDNSIYVCAPRYMKPYINVKYVEGSCWELNNEFVEVDTIANGYCLDSIKKNIHDYLYRNCLTGGALRSLGNKQLLMTSPYSYDGRGLLIYSRFQTESNSRVSTYLRVDDHMSKYQLTGFSLAVGKIYRQNGVRTAVLGAPGMPHANLTNLKIGYGQVMLVQLVDNSLFFKGLLFGDSFGSAFGYSVLVMDLNNDGFDELIVGAPFAANNRGKVFVYRNQIQDETNEAGYTFPLSVKKPLLFESLKKSDTGQFGNCVENIGDINKDSYLDFAVSSPFEEDGRGSVYIYLGDKDFVITLSQKIDASSIDPDFRGFGFSIYGRNEDIDANNFPDVVIGAAVSGHVVGLRTRPLLKIYAENMLPSQDHIISYNFETLPKCSFEERLVPCLEIKVSMFYYFPHLNNCPTNQQSLIVNYTIDLDRTFLNSSASKRVHFDGRINLIRNSVTINCKVPSVASNSNNKRYSVLFPNTVFFNISLPIDIVLRWTAINTNVPKRNYKMEEPLADLSQYPMMDKKYSELSNKILFGAECTPDSCKPILTLQSELSLPKIDDQYDLYIGSSSSFDLSIDVGNIASTPDNRAYNTFIKVDYISTDIKLISIYPGQHRLSSSGLTYAVSNPLEIKTVEKIRLQFAISNDFIQKAQKYIFINISLSAMSPQHHLNPTIMKIRIRMIANIEMKVSVTHLNLPTFISMPTLGFSAIKQEKKIGPQFKIKISLSNLEERSVVISSKLVIYFPWEVAGDPSQPHGQYLLYLLNMPKFFISGGSRNISCDGASLTKLVNPIRTKMLESKKIENEIRDVSIANISMPKNAPKLPKLKRDLLLISNSDESLLKSAWQKNVLLDCMKGSARCVPIVCDMGPLSRQSGEINLELNFRVWIHTFVENFIKYKIVQTEIPIIWVPEADYDIVLKNPDGAFKTAGIKVDNLQKPKAPPTLNFVWAVIIAVCIGVILLATIVSILYKCHFFRRKNVAADRKRRKSSKST